MKKSHIPKTNHSYCCCWWLRFFYIYIPRKSFSAEEKCNYILHKYCSLWKLEMVKCRQVVVWVYWEEFPFALQTRSNLMFRPIYSITNELTGTFRNTLGTCLQHNYLDRNWQNMEYQLRKMNRSKIQLDFKWWKI